MSPESTAEVCDTLIVEDDENCSHLLDKFLRVRGHITRCVTSVAEAKGRLSPDCKRMILDLNLPDGMGTEVLRQIRDADLPIKVAVVTGMNDRGTLAELSNLRPDAFFVKPVDLMDLATWMKSVA